MKAYGVNFHDNDLVPIDATAAQRDGIVREFKKGLKDNNLVCPMATTNLFGDPVFKDGAFTSNNASIRAYAIQKTMRAMDLGMSAGRRFTWFWGGREGWRRMRRRIRWRQLGGFARRLIFLLRIQHSAGV